MQKTQNFSLNKPEAGDPLRVADFNENADKIDTTLMALNTAVAAAGNCKITSGSYVGTGAYGSGNPTKITFPFVPKAAFIVSSHYGGSRAVYLNGCGYIHTQTTDFSSVAACTLTNCTLSWYNTNSAEKQLNLSGYSYLWVAIG